MMKAFFKSILLCCGILFCPQLVGQGTVRMGGPTASEQAKGDLELAREYYANEEYEKALKYLAKLPINYRFNEVYELKLNCHLSLEQYDEAERLVKNYVKNSRGNDIDFLIDLMAVYIKQEKTTKADKLVDDLLEDITKKPSLAYSYANAFQKKGYPRIALEIYEIGEEQMPNANFDYQKALLYGEIGDIKRMYAAYVEMVERTPTYMPSVKQLLSRALREEGSSDNTEYLKEILIQKIQDGGPSTMNELLVFVFIQEKNFSGAFIQLKALDRRNPGNKAELYNLGRVAMNNEEYDLSIRIFDYIVKAGDKYAFYEQALSDRLRARNLKLEAENVTKTEIWLDLQRDYFKTIDILKGMPEVGPLTIDVAHITAFRLNETDTAIALLEKLLSKGYLGKTDMALAKVELGDILLYTGERWDAILMYGQAEKAFEQSPIGQEAKFKRAKAAYYVGDFQWALSIFNALKESTSKLIANDAMHYSLLINDNIALDSNMEAMSMYARADLMNYQGKRDSALRVLDMMDIAFPGHKIQDEVLFLKAKILYVQKNYEESAKVYQQLIDLYGKDLLADDAMYALAELYLEKLGQPNDAMDLYQKIFTEHPDSFFAPDARKKFREMRGDTVIN